jgi:adenylosuccinate synthase
VNLSVSQLAEKIELVSQEKVFLIKNLYNYDYDFDPVKLAQECKEKFEKLGIRVENTEILLNQEIKRGKNILFEGAQGVLLDIDFGTYPYVTSSNASTNGVGSGAGVTSLDNVIGIVKAYTTRVGEGPFPTEQDNEIGEKLRAKGDEFGATTGRPRRCGWLDIPLLRYSTIVANVNEIFLTKLDVLSEFEEIKVCVEYELNGEKMRIPRSMDSVTLYSVKPVYKTFKGWKTKISDVRTFSELPSEAKEYIKFIESEIGVPIKYISVGPSREQTIVL